MNDINSRVKKIRKKLGYSQRDVAEHLGIKLSTYSQRERCGDLTGEFLIELSKLFEVDVKAFLYDDANFQIESNKKHEGYELNQREVQILTIYRNLSKDNKNAVFGFAYRLLKKLP